MYPDLVDQFRSGLIAACQDIPAGSVLLLSGGLDSGVILAACVAAGVRVDVITASFGPYLNEDNRLAALRAKCVAPDYLFTHLPVCRDETNVLQYIRQAIITDGRPLKTSIEVAQMVYPLVDVLVAAGYQAAINGMAGGTLWGVTKETMFKLHKGGHDAWQAAVRSGLELELDDNQASATACTRKIFQAAGLGFIDPLLATTDLLLACTYDQLNRPKQKQLALDAFPILKHTPTRTGGMQVVSGVREYMTLLAKENGFRSSVAWYNHIARSMGVPLRG